jgi:hypothetical protein
MLLALALIALIAALLVTLRIIFAAPSCGGDCRQGRKPCSCRRGQAAEEPHGECTRCGGSHPLSECRWPLIQQK